jgi:excinuclease UvrABC helicase subunit UvrB
MVNKKTSFSDANFKKTEKILDKVHTDVVEPIVEPIAEPTPTKVVEQEKTQMDVVLEEIEKLKAKNEELEA